MYSKVKKERNHISMLLIKIYEKWRGGYLFGDHFSTVARGRKLYFIVLFRVGSAYVVWCSLVLACGRQSMILLFYITIGC